MVTRIARASPWALTQVEGRFAGPMVYRSVLPAADDRSYIVKDSQNHAPDVLANDLYGDWRLWWLIPELNQLEDPTFDLKAGMTVRVPSVDRARTYS